MNARPALPRHRTHQRGAAVVTALLMVTLAVVIVSGMLWRQQVQIRSIENQRLTAQAAWIERAAVDWARLILRDDQRRSRVDYLGEPWSVPVAETRLSDFLGAGLRTDQAGETSFLSGRIVDAQARFNLTNLYIWNASGTGRVVEIDLPSLLVYRRLLQTLGMNPSLAEPTAQYLVRAARGASPDGQPVPRPPDTAADLLAIPGYNPDMVAALEPFIVFLPERTKINANTAEPEVLAAAIDKLPLDRARELVRQRDRAYFRNTGDISTQLRAVAPQAGSTAGEALEVSTHYFLVYGLVRHERARRLQVSLVQRAPTLGSGNTTRVLWVRDTDRLPEAP
ncbi:type II secretion system minor pseudopilin GspK [Cupriavidus campinensis]|uniref:Type II secretion system protein K n=1 Tax=Cupriavidus campinensis TaxID=151783 RepID=A0AAE9I1T7_9BURK|nr:type II secretion system minor pseudopilin GspK [Cupriavidus campinensis]URF04030.1 type II secretion system minor pseudopilin GspK [Cupriavidus campinensis]